MLNRHQKSRLRIYYSALKMKPCWKCWEVKHISEFNSDRSKVDGLDKLCAKCECVRSGISYHVNKSSSARHRKKYEQENKEKKRAHCALYLAVKTGKIIRPGACASCGKSCVPDGHHDNYSAPLDVTWLCRACHGKKHERLSNGN